ncbi:hypothetical protein N5J75_11170 [Pantoea brenneri]|uniref:hypothetical protein n=1 Tax=Pantoea brenneri TaxID=472694 RepID=UPI00244C8371|nr:hypothetical protein [Pantoea brenneri]MDH2123758.1 hypothetical protein [Pantoea brenneri]
MGGKFKGKLKPRDKETSSLVGMSPEASSKEIDNSPPTFSLRYLQKDFCVDCCEKNEKAALADRLFKLSKLSWADIRKADRHGLGTEKISRNSIKAPIPHHVTEDVEFIAFRFCGKAPMVGYKLNSTFYILWLDRVFKLYDH